MQMIVLLHEEQVGGGKEQEHSYQIDPVRKDGVGHEVDESEGYRQLKASIYQTHCDV